jgi:hypothetical protein
MVLVLRIIINQMLQLYLLQDPSIHNAALVVYRVSSHGSPEDGVEHGFRIGLENGLQFMRECIEEVLERVDVVEVSHYAELDFDGEVEEVVVRFRFEFRHFGCCLFFGQDEFWCFVVD